MANNKLPCSDVGQCKAATLLHPYVRCVGSHAAHHRCDRIRIDRRLLARLSSSVLAKANVGQRLAATILHPCVNRVGPHAAHHRPPPSNMSYAQVADRLTETLRAHHLVLLLNLRDGPDALLPLLAPDSGKLRILVGAAAKRYPNQPCLRAECTP